MVLARAGTVWYAHATLARGASVQQVLRDTQFQRTRLTALEVNEESGLRGFLMTGDRGFLNTYPATSAPFPQTVERLRSDLRHLNLPAGDLDALDRIHARWERSVLRPLLENPHRSDALALQYRSQDLIKAFSATQVRFRTLIDAAAVRADEQLRTNIDRTLISGTLASLVVIAIGVLLAISQFRATREFDKVSALYRNERRVTNLLQDAFLPKQLPAPAGIELHGRYAPAANELRVGGDWYDAFELSDGRLLFSIGDVAGHGIEAAVAMNRARQAILAGSVGAGDPAAILTRANAAIFAQDAVMVTAICGYIDPANLEIVYATAGQSGAVARPLRKRTGSAAGRRRAARYFRRFALPDVHRARRVRRRSRVVHGRRYRASTRAGRRGSAIDRRRGRRRYGG